MNRSQWKAVLEKAIRLTANRPDIAGVDVGMASRKGKRVRRLAIRFHVHSKRPESELEPSQRLPRRIDGVRCDVVEASYRALGSPDPFATPLQPGLSIGNLLRGTTGTVGPLVVDRQGGGLGLLSCWHVLCASADSMPGEQIVQPGLAHRGMQAARKVASLARAVDLQDGFDVALALLDVDVAHASHLWGSGTAVQGVQRLQRGMKLVKAGAVTGTTYGYVDSDAAGVFEIELGRFGDTSPSRSLRGWVLRLDARTKGRELTMEGDSGALWVNESNGKAVALTFAGEDGKPRSAEQTLVHDLYDVLDRIGVDLYLGQ
ncbi:TPA: hypothetical protein ACKP22_001557 [Pseudomonas putida]